MKRVISIIVMMLISIGAFAQISSVKTQDSIKTITRFRGGHCSLNVQGDIYYISLISTNRFDSPTFVYLGEGKDSAIQTLKDLQELHASMEKGDFADFSIKAMGKEFNYKVTKFDRFNFSFYDVGAAGSVYFATTEMKTLINKLSQ